MQLRQLAPQFPDIAFFTLDVEGSSANTAFALEKVMRKPDSRRAGAVRGQQQHSCGGGGGAVAAAMRTCWSCWELEASTALVASVRVLPGLLSLSLRLA